jgi:aryl-alcohol dehydrogenase-like predicted oxidoreductase
VLRKAFEACEELAAQGLIGAYGCATWNGFRVPPGDPGHLNLEELLEDARAAGGRDHHFRWIQLPLNLAMPEAFSAATQRFAGELLTPLEAARAAGLEVQVSASLMQARILAKLQADLLPGCRTPAQAALQFARSCPGVATALCGMSSPGHVAENLELLRLPKADRRELEALAG